MESAWRWTLLMGLFFVHSSHAQGTMESSGKLQPVVVGLTAVMCFLFVIFAANLVNRLFCSKKKDMEERAENDAEPRATLNVYENVAMEMEEGSSKATELKVEENKLTNL